MNQETQLQIAAGLVVVAEGLERQAKTLRSTASLLRHPHSLPAVAEVPES